MSAPQATCGVGPVMPCDPNAPTVERDRIGALSSLDLRGLVEWRRFLKLCLSEIMMSNSTIDDVERWFFEYFEAFIAISSSRAKSDDILSYWGVPLHVSGPNLSKWIESPKNVVKFLEEVQHVLRQAGYVLTKMLDKKTTIYNANAARVEAIMSRRRNDGSEIDRAAVSFEIRRSRERWVVISTTGAPTERSKLADIW